MARLSPPPNTTQCNCGIDLRDEEMISDNYQNADYLLCPQCKLAIFAFVSNTDDKTQKPIITKERMGQHDASTVLYKIRKRRRRAEEFDKHKRQLS